MTGTPQIVYIQPDVGSEVDHEAVTIRDVAVVYCKDEARKKQIEELVFMHVDIHSKRRYAVSSMALIACIDREIKNDIVIYNIGEKEFIVSVSKKPQSGYVVRAKIMLVTVITFFGSVFAIMTYNEDVDVTGVFDKLYAIVMDSERSSPGVLEGAYAFGVAAGVILFFNHFGKRKLTKEPTPMEIEMEKYEADITETLLKASARKNEMIDGQRFGSAKEDVEEKT